LNGKNHHLQILTHLHSSRDSSQGMRGGKSMRFSLIFNSELEDVVKTHNLPSNSHIYNIFFKII